MAFARFSNDFLMESFTLVDNLFINEHLPYCDEKQIKVYLYGLYMCAVPQRENSLDSMCAVLDMTIDEIVSAYCYFEDAGLCRVCCKNPLEVTYLALKRAMQPPKKYKSEKWHDFNKELQSLFHERMLTPNEYNEYYQFLDSSKLDPSAMLMIAQYCINLKGESVRYPYILTVARNWVADGVRTVADVETRLNEYEAQSENMRSVLAALGRKGGADLEEKQMLLKWTRSWGFDMDAVLAAAKALKGGKTFSKLDRKLDEFYRASIFTAEQIRDYGSYREKMRDLAVAVNKTIGVYYESLDHVIEFYTIPWTSKGFDDEALKKIAHYCFVSNIRTLDGMNGVVTKLYSEGYLTSKGVDQFIGEQLSRDENIKAVITATGRNRKVTQTDREFYRNWTSVWGFDDAVLLYAASLACGAAYPMPFINRLLSEWKAAGVATVEQAKKRGTCAPAGGNTSKNFTEREYTEEQLRSVIANLDTLKDSDL